jgi:flavin-dependent dehydrogenase
MDTTDLQLVIVGGGPAGLFTGLHALRRAPELTGQVLVLERQRYPRDKTCAGMVAGRAWRLLARSGLRLEIPTLPVQRLVLSLGDGEVQAHQAGLGRIVRRTDFDHALAQEARRRGVLVQEGARVVGVEPHPAGVRVHLADGRQIHARAVVGADGVGSVVRRAAGFPRRERLARALEVITERTAEPLADAVHFDLRQRDLQGYAWDFPALPRSQDGPGLVSRGVYAQRWAGPGELRDHLAAHLARRGLSLARYPVRQLAQRPFDPRAPIARPRLLLVGEAAGVDSITGEGIPQALAYGALAGRYLARALRRDELGFGDWLAQVRRAGFGRRLRTLRASGVLFFGPRRRQMERLIQSTPAILQLWAQDFAGSPLSPTALLQGLRQLAPHLPRQGALVARALAAVLLPP